MSLTRRERRALRAIERALILEDPLLADLLRGPPARAAPATVLARFAWSFFCLSIVLGVTGLVLGDADLMTGAGLVLVVSPPLLLLIAAVYRCER